MNFFLADKDMNKKNRFWTRAKKKKDAFRWSLWGRVDRRPFLLPLPLHPLRSEHSQLVLVVVHAMKQKKCILSLPCQSIPPFLLACSIIKTRPTFFSLFFFCLFPQHTSFYFARHRHKKKAKKKKRTMRITTLSLLLALSAINFSTTLAQSGSFVINYQGPSEPEHQLSVMSMMAGAVEPEDPSYDPKVTDYTDWSCKPSKAHPYPVIMLHGLLAPSFTRFVGIFFQIRLLFLLNWRRWILILIKTKPPCPCLVDMQL